MHYIHEVYQASQIKKLILRKDKMYLKKFQLPHQLDQGIKAQEVEKKRKKPRSQEINQEVKKSHPHPSLK